MARKAMRMPMIVYDDIKALSHMQAGEVITRVYQYARNGVVVLSDDAQVNDVLLRITRQIEFFTENDEEWERDLDIWHAVMEEAEEGHAE